MTEERGVSQAGHATGGAKVATHDDLEWFEGWEDGAAVLAFLRAATPSLGASMERRATSVA